MSSSILTKDVSEMMVALMKATGAYVHHRISSTDGRHAYIDGMKMCISVFDQGWTDVSVVLSKVNGLRSEVDHMYGTSMFSNKKVKEMYFNMAVDNTLDIVRSINGRFIVGMSEAPRLCKGTSLLVVTTGEELFG